MYGEPALFGRPWLTCQARTVSVSIRYAAVVEPGKDSENLTIDAISLAVSLKNRTRQFPRYSVFMPMTTLDPAMAPYEPTGEVLLKLDVQGGN
jgi:hypothetical protein